MPQEQLKRAETEERPFLIGAHLPGGIHVTLRTGRDADGSWRTHYPESVKDAVFPPRLDRRPGGALEGERESLSRVG